MSERPVLVFDGDCGFCTTAKDWIAARAEIEAVPYQWADLAALGLTEAEGARRIHVIGDTVPGGRRSGGYAAAWLLRSARGRGWRLLGTVLGAPVLRWGTDLGYRVVAANRHRLPGGSPACALPHPSSPSSPSTPPSR